MEEFDVNIRSIARITFDLDFAFVEFSRIRLIPRPKPVPSPSGRGIEFLEKGLLKFLTDPGCRYLSPEPARSEGSTRV